MAGRAATQTRGQTPLEGRKGLSQEGETNMRGRRAVNTAGLGGPEALAYDSASRTLGRRTERRSQEEAG